MIGGVQWQWGGMIMGTFADGDCKSVGAGWQVGWLADCLQFEWLAGWMAGWLAVLLAC